MSQLTNRVSRPTRQDRVIIASPYLFGDFASVQMKALEATVQVFKLDKGELGQAVTRFLAAGCLSEHKMDLLRALVQSDPRQGPYWRELWPKVIRHYHIEIGTQLLLGVPRVNEAMAAFLDGLIDRRARIDVICNWSGSLLDVLLSTVLPHIHDSQILEPIDRASLGAGPKGLWIGRAGEGSSEARRRGHAVLCVPQEFHNDHVAEAIAMVEALKTTSHGRRLRGPARLHMVGNRFRAPA
ncbi:MAG: hypothetical protein AAF311_00060 [Pseudomonadota bacterium]